MDREIGLHSPSLLVHLSSRPPLLLCCETVLGGGTCTRIIGKNQKTWLLSLGVTLHSSVPHPVLTRLSSLYKEKVEFQESVLQRMSRMAITNRLLQYTRHYRCASRKLAPCFHASADGYATQTDSPAASSTDLTAGQQQQELLAKLQKLSCEIFDEALPTAGRTGDRFLKRPLAGSDYSAYWPMSLKELFRGDRVPESQSVLLTSSLTPTSATMSSPTAVDAKSASSSSALAKPLGRKWLAVPMSLKAVKEDYSSLPTSTDEVYRLNVVERDKSRLKAPPKKGKYKHNTPWHTTISCKPPFPLGQNKRATKGKKK